MCIQYEGLIAFKSVRVHPIAFLLVFNTTSNLSSSSGARELLRMTGFLHYFPKQAYFMWGGNYFNSSKRGVNYIDHRCLPLWTTWGRSASRWDGRDKLSLPWTVLVHNWRGLWKWECKPWIYGLFWDVFHVLIQINLYIRPLPLSTCFLRGPNYTPSSTTRHPKLHH